jgi:hypothetical protein
MQETVVVFQKIDIDGEIAKIDLFTTSILERAYLAEHYADVSATLRKRNGKWVLTSCKVMSIPWRKYF